MSAVDLLPCPFCGGEAEVAVFRRESYGYYCETRGVKCKKCWCKTEAFETEAYERGRGMYPVDADGPAIAAWNRRAPVSATQNYADPVSSAAPVSADLSDPIVVHANMMRGMIAKPSPEQIKHLYPDLFPPVSAGKAKALVWDKWGEAKGGGAKYNVYEFGGRGLWNCVCYPHEDQLYRLAYGVSQKAAKAAAQADYEARILSALQPGDGWQGISSAPKDG